jgi:hypothetical protein
LKRLLIISPYFAPVNAADMQRVRMSLPYFADNGWEAEVVMVDEKYTDMVNDNLLLQTIPGHIKIHRVKAFDKSFTARFGLGSIALRALWFYKQKVNQLLTIGKYDLIYFSTTQFPVCILGAYWKRKFGIPYVIDMQDPWHSTYYQDKPRSLRPKKYWFSYRLNKYLEPIAMRQVDGLISVSEDYITDLKSRYPGIKHVHAETITFGAFGKDIEIAIANQHLFTPILQSGYINIVYVGRGGADMHRSVTTVFDAVKHGLQNNPALYTRVKLYFIGTSYAPAGEGKATILPLAMQYGLGENVVEITDRISFYHTLVTLKQADGLFMPGSDDPKYTASKTYPYLATQKPLLAIFHPLSPAINVLKEYGAKYCYTFENIQRDDINRFISDLAVDKGRIQKYQPDAIEKYSAQQMTKKQCLLFDKVLNGKT